MKITCSSRMSAVRPSRRTTPCPRRTNTMSSSFASGIRLAVPPALIAMTPILPWPAPPRSRSINQCASTSPELIRSAKLEPVDRSVVARYIVCIVGASKLRSGGRLNHPHAAIHHEILAGNVIGPFGREKCRCSDQIVRRRHAAQNRFVPGKLFNRVRLVSIASLNEILVQAIPERGFDETRTEAVHRDVVFTERLGAGLRKRDDAGFARAVNRSDLFADLSRDRSGIDDLAAAVLCD